MEEVGERGHHAVRPHSARGSPLARSARGGAGSGGPGEPDARRPTGPRQASPNGASGEARVVEHHGTARDDLIVTRDAIILDHGKISIASGCPPVPVTLKGTKKGTKVKAKWAGILSRTPNVSVVEQPFEEFQAPANSYSFALFHLVYHDTYWVSAKYKVKEQDPNLLVGKLYTAMKPGGIVGVIDHVGAAGDTRATVDKLHRIDPAVVKADFLRGGFKLVAESQHLRAADDDHTKLVFDPSVRGKTDRFVFKFVKPKK